MARGKNGSATATRRLAAAEDEILALKAEARSAELAHSAEVRELKAEIQNLQGDLTRRVKEVSAQQILAAQDSARAAIATAEERATSRVRESLRFLFTHAVDIAMPAAENGGSSKWADLADLAGLGLGELMDLDPNNTLNARGRRMTSRRANLNADLRRSHELRGVQ